MAKKRTTKRKIKTLKTLIDVLPTRDVQTKDVKALILQALLDRPDAREHKHRAKYRGQDATFMKLLVDIIKNEDSASFEDDYLAVMAGEYDDEDDEPLDED